MFDTERLIAEIHARECIWNSSIKEYGDRSLRRLAWEDVASIMYDDWEMFSPTKKNETVLQLQKKWKHHRDYFVRERNKEKKRRTPYLDMLHFLLQSFNEEVKNENIIDSFNLDSSSEQSSVSKPIQTKKIKKRKGLSLYHNHFLNSMKNIEENNMNPHLNFLLSLLPDMETMSERQIFEFKFEIMKVLQEIKYSNHITSGFEPSTSTCQGTNDPLEASIVIPKKEPQ
ncbi:unnamed protein product [Diatraea saccharalis]|uniref:MADF domain-containing protein n=1 Tax=Diatraea saccharalis TaxID=40085 RepID=A0A9N9QYA9_9NEOP|nr:unnamed protein product [Diatraea saccharalis]